MYENTHIQVMSCFFLLTTIAVKRETAERQEKKSQNIQRYSVAAHT